MRVNPSHQFESEPAAGVPVAQAYPTYDAATNTWGFTTDPAEADGAFVPGAAAGYGAVDTTSTTNLISVAAIGQTVLMFDGGA